MHVVGRMASFSRSQWVKQGQHYLSMLGLNSNRVIVRGPRNVISHVIIFDMTIDTFCPDIKITKVKFDLSWLQFTVVTVAVPSTGNWLTGFDLMLIWVIHASQVSNSVSMTGHMNKRCYLHTFGNKRVVTDIFMNINIIISVLTLEKNHNALVV